MQLFSTYGVASLVVSGHLGAETVEGAVDGVFVTNDGPGAAVAVAVGQGGADEKGQLPQKLDEKVELHGDFL